MRTQQRGQSQATMKPDTGMTGVNMHHSAAQWDLVQCWHGAACLVVGGMVCCMPLCPVLCVVVKGQAASA